MEGSWDPCSIDFGTVSGGPGEAKIWFSLRSGYNFDIFGYSNISRLSNSQKHRFYVRFGGQVGVRKRTSWLPEPKISGLKLLFGGSKHRSRMDIEKKSEKRTMDARVGVRGGAWGRHFESEKSENLCCACDTPCPKGAAD